jgi:hypothetical protein
LAAKQLSLLVHLNAGENFKLAHARALFVVSCLRVGFRG